MKIKIHSLTDLITNSSTVIYTYQHNSVPILKDLVNEILSMMNVKETCDDIFDVSIEKEDEDYDMGDKSLVIKAKQPQYKKLADLLVKFLSSVEFQEGHD